MSNYRRNRVPGGTFFYTVNLLDRRSDLLVTGVDRLRAAVRRVRALAPFHIDAWVFLPDHPHPSLPRKRGRVREGDAAPRRRRLSQSLASDQTRLCEIPAQCGTAPAMMTRSGERGVWQRRCSEHTIWDDYDFAVHFDYIYFDPAKHDLVSHPTDWPHSTFRRCLAGLYSAEWIGNCDGTAAHRRTPIRQGRRPQEDPPALAAECAALFRPTLAEPTPRT